jgi:hypothetical protein
MARLGAAVQGKEGRQGRQGKAMLSRSCSRGLVHGVAGKAVIGIVRFGEACWGLAVPVDIGVNLHYTEAR